MHYLLTELLHNRLSAQPTPASRQQCVWQVETVAAKSRSGTALCEVREEAGQEEEAAIKQHPLTPCTERFSFGAVERKGGGEGRKKGPDPFLR